MVGTKYRPYLSWTDCNLKVKWILAKISKGAIFPAFLAIFL